MENQIANHTAQKDLRVKKTDKALYDAMFTMLSCQNFNAITVNAICAEALISRAAFYAHFNDKYDLLKYLFSEIKKNIFKDVYNYEALEQDVNQFVCSNKKFITNVMRNANSETLSLVRGFMASVADLMTKRKASNKSSPQHIILYNFLIGGLVNLLTWVVENNFPPEISIMNPYVYEMLQSMTIWDAEQERKEFAAKK